MSFTRTRNDKCATNLHTLRSVNVGEYRLFPGFVENNNQCFSATGPVGSKVDVSTTKQKCSLDWGEMAHVESELQSRNIPLSDCNDNRINNHYNKNKVFNYIKLIH